MGINYTRAAITGILLCFISSTGIAQSYRILLSNDDGIESSLLAVLKTELEKLPDTEVVVSAPAENQSGSSHGSGINPLQVDRYTVDGEFFGYAVHGRPADAVRFGIVELGKDEPFDLVVSGINRGANVGDVSHLSGTVGAAMEGIYQGIPALAVSEDTQGVDTTVSARLAAQIVARYESDGAPEGILLSLNIPRGELRGIAIRPMGDSYLKTAAYNVESQSGDSTTYSRERIIVRSDNAESDTYAYQQGYATITPIKFDWTATEYIGEVESWNIQLPD